MYKWSLTFKNCESPFGTPTTDTIWYINYVLVTQLCPILCNPVDCIPPGSSVAGILTILLFFLKQKTTPERSWGPYCIVISTTWVTMGNAKSTCILGSQSSLGAWLIHYYPWPVLEVYNNWEIVTLTQRKVHVLISVLNKDLFI